MAPQLDCYLHRRNCSSCGKADAWLQAENITAAMLNDMLGPHGNLRAPCLRFGTTLLVGFHAQMYSQALSLEKQES